MTMTGRRTKIVISDPIEDALLGMVWDDGQVRAAAVAKAFGLSRKQLAETVGLGRETFYRRSREESAKAQSRLREMVEIVNRVAEWAGGTTQAMAWYRAQPIAALGGRTAESLVKTGEAATLRDYLDHFALGGYA